MTTTATLTTHVSLAPAARRAPAAHVSCAPLLDERGARTILGAADEALGLASPVVPSASSMFGPRGVCSASDGSLWVSDTGHHRVLGWRIAPQADNTPADILLGQPAFDREGRNAQGSASENSLNVPTGIATCGPLGEGLAVADAWNHRVLIWHRRPTQSHQRPDVVLGQANFDGGESNRGQDHPTASTLFWPYCVSWDGARLWVADTGNRRVLMWSRLPQRNGDAADLVLGQTDFDHRDENGGGSPTAASMRWPHAISFPVGGLCVADAGNNRLMLWRHRPEANNRPCDVVAGQSGVQLVEHNQGSYYPDAACLNMPYGATLAGELLVVADTANSRLLAWRVDALTRHGVNAHALAAQTDWNSKGDNRWLPAARDSVCWPYSVALLGQRDGKDMLLVADSGNNRVMLWPLSAGRG
jgi:NHL repeat-containing protein